MSVPYSIRDEDIIDLAALRFALREAEIRVSETCAADLTPRDAQKLLDQSLDNRGAAAAGSIAAENCVRFEGEKAVGSPYRAAKQRVYSMYALHPDTAEQIIEALEALMKSVGPRYRIPTRAREHTAKTVRNRAPEKEEE